MLFYCKRPVFTTELEVEFVNTYLKRFGSNIVWTDYDKM